MPAIKRLCLWAVWIIAGLLIICVKALWFVSSFLLVLAMVIEDKIGPVD